MVAELSRFFTGVIFLPRDGRACCWSYFLHGKCHKQSACRHDHSLSVGNGAWVLMNNIRLAQHSIDFCLPQLSHMALPDLLKRCRQLKHTVRVLLDDVQSERNATRHATALTTCCGRWQQVRYLSNLHHKFILIDRQVLMSGSYNWTSVGACNDEDVQSTSNVQLVRQYTERFEFLWNLAGDACNSVVVASAESAKVLVELTPPPSPTTVQKNMMIITKEKLFFPRAVFIDPILPRPSCCDPLNCREFDQKTCAVCRDDRFLIIPDAVLTLLNVLNSATKSIDACWYSARHPRLLDLLWQKATHEKVRVRIILDGNNRRALADAWNQRRQRYSTIEKMQNFEVKYKLSVLDTDPEAARTKKNGSHARYLMHHKFAVIDERIVMHGSYNWARFATYYDDVLVSDEQKVVNRFREQFEAMWCAKEGYEVVVSGA